MGTVINLHRGSGGGLDTADDERLGGQYLLDGALRSYVGENETPAFVIVNKRKGVTVEREEGTETYKPSRACRTLVAITDVRVLIAVGGGGADGDRIISVPLSTITDVEADESLLGGSLHLDTDTGEAWSIPCRGDLDQVVDYLTQAQRAWSRADRFTAEVEDYLDTARERHSAGDYEGVLEATDDAMSMIAHGMDRLQRFQMGDGVVANTDFQSQRETIEELRRQAHAGIATVRRDECRELAAADEYQAAHDCLTEALEAIEQALATDGSTPPDDELVDRVDEIEWKLAELEVDPKASAAAALGNARAQVDPEERAAQLRTALDQYRDVLGLCWGPDADFDGDPDEIRARITTVVDELVAARTDAAQRSLVAADRLTVRGRVEQALEECRQADAHLDAAREVVEELAPGRHATLDIWAATVDDQRARTEGRAATDDDPPEQPPHGDQMVTTGFEFGEKPTGTVGDGVETDTTAFGQLDREAFTRLVAEVWRSMGWEATAFTESLDQYDVIATRSDPIEVGVLVWAVHRPGRKLEAAVIDRCVADRATVDRADVGAVVTTGSIPDTVRERAAERDVKLLDKTDLLDLLEREGLTEWLEDVDE